MVVGAALAIILLLFFQINWLQHSAQLIEEQFDQKATMALCNAVDELQAKDDPHLKIELTCEKAIPECEPSCLQTNVDELDLHQALQASMERYDIDLGFQVDVLSVPTRRDPKAPIYCTSISGLTNDSRSLQVSFPGKEQYVIDQLGLMAGTSFLILIAFCVLFILIVLRLVQQHKMNAASIAFFNNMAHEFRTPLTNIQLATNMLEKKIQAPQYNRYIHVIQNEGHRLREQIERMLQVAKMERGEYIIAREPIELDSLIQEVVDDMRMQVIAKNGILQVHETEEDTWIEGDRLHLSNAIRNLVDNAIKYCQKAPQIDIEVIRQTDQVELRFVDNGVGICELDRKQIFMPYHRIAQGNIHDEKGFGLGLAYVKKVIELHDGRIALESSNPNGSIFSISLPLKSA